jgi:hypothetical protein
MRKYGSVNIPDVDGGIIHAYKDRICKCGQKLNSYNPNRYCYACQRKQYLIAIQKWEKNKKYLQGRVYA